MSTEALEKMLAKGMDNALLRFGLGKAHLDGGDTAQGAEHLQRCVEFDPGYSAAWKLLGKALLAQGEHDAARQAWQQGIAAAQAKGDKQAEKEMSVFLRKLDKPR
ncbi:tetratricopeptide repeat protein [Ectopseudomonas khazarica]|uniref:tetratricopeptide repeat protein n=1 Tax=Ectopseudomonas khazarica TaxID=2502979 RepID=UPI003A92512F